MLSGKHEKLRKLEELLQKKGDSSRRFINSIYTGNITERIKLLSEAGHRKNNLS